MLLSLFYTISYLVLLTGILFFKKNERKLSVLVWITMSVMTSFCLQALSAALLYKTGLPISMPVIAAFNLVTGGILWFFIIKKGRQNYYLDKADLIAFIVLFLVAGFTYAKRFTIGHDISFASIDSATLYETAKSIVLDQKLTTNMFLATVNSAMPMQAALPITGEFYMFKTFILWEAGYFLLSGLFFYILIRELLKNRELKIFAVVSSVIYMLGYPMYSLIFGFSYFGLSISVIAYILYAAILYIDRRVGRLNSVLMLNLGLFGLFLCYMLFVPAIFPGVLLAILIYMKMTGRLFSLRTVKAGLSIFLAPSIAGLLVTASNLVFLNAGSSGSGSSGGGGGASSGPTGIAIDGGCYNDMYSNFIILLPLIITGLVICIRKLWDIRTSKEVPASNSKDVPGSNSEDVSASNSKEVTESNSKDVPASNSKDVTASNSKEVTASNSKDVSASNSEEVSASNSKDVPASNSEEVPESNSKEVPALRDRIVTAAGGEKAADAGKAAGSSAGFATVILSVFIVMLLFMAVMFAGVMTGRVSIYYYVRNNNVLALLSWTLVILAASEMWDRAKTIYISFIAVFAAMILIIITGADAKILSRNERAIRVGAESFLDIYYFNNEFNKFVGDVNINDIEMIKFASENVNPDINTENTEVCVVGGEVYTAWFSKLTGNNKIRPVNDSVTLSDVDFSDYKYVCVQKLDIYEQSKDIIDTLGDVVYSNERGLIIKMK